MTLHDSPRILYVSTRRAWPLDAGYAVRSHSLAVACIAGGTCDILFVAPGDEQRDLPPRLGAATIEVFRVPRHSAVRTMTRWLCGRQPWGWSRVDWSAAATRITERLAVGDYTHVLVSGIDGWSAIEPAVRHLVTLDFDDVETFKIEHRLASKRIAYPGIAGRLAAIRDRIDLRRWRRIERDILTFARASVVCSDVDRVALGAANVYTVPNTFPDLAGAGSERAHTPAGRSIVFVGSLTTPPNREACRYLVTEIMPHVWAADPSVSLRLVGRPAPDVASLDRPPQVVVVGFVDDLADELGAADLVVAPFLSGGGTRIKILEAFRHGIPVVTTTVGVSGIDVSDGVHLLIRDDPVAFAAACIGLLADAERAATLVENGSALVNDRYSVAAVSEAMRQMFESV